MENTLTLKQKRIFAFIEEITKQKGVPPTFREIQKHFGFSSIGTVYSHIRTLKKKKLLQEGKYARVLINTKPKNSAAFIELPLIGELMQGSPPKIWSESSSYTIPESFLSNEAPAYLFLAKGKSLHSELIDDEDLILVQAGILPEEGDSIFALVEGAVLIKTYFKEAAGIRLESKVGGVPPLFFEEDALLIQGVITAVIRQL